MNHELLPQRTPQEHHQDIFNLSILEAPETLEEVAQRYVEIVRTANKTIDIVSGEANSRLYSDLDVMAALREAKEQGIRINIVVGPVLSVYINGEGNRLSGLLDLVNNGILCLYTRDRRGLGQHFMIIDGKTVVAEDYHEPMAPLGDRLATPYADKDAIPFIINFQSYTEGLNAKRCFDPENELLRLTEREIRGIKQMVGDDYNALSGSEISKLHKKFLRKQAKIRQKLLRRFNDIVYLE